MISRSLRPDALGVSARLAQRSALPLTAAVLVKAAETMTLWSERRRTRRTLAGLPKHLLDDIGMTGDVAYTEARRPFWRS
ncbi:MAG: DUF1127 domain-containing protein [Celeribacter sp.]